MTPRAVRGSLARSSRARTDVKVLDAAMERVTVDSRHRSDQAPGSIHHQSHTDTALMTPSVRLKQKKKNRGDECLPRSLFELAARIQSSFIQYSRCKNS